MARGSPADRTGPGHPEPVIAPPTPPTAPVPPDPAASDEGALRTERLQAIARVTRKITHDLNNFLMVFGGGVDHVRTFMATNPEGALRMLDNMEGAVEGAEELVATLQRFRGGAEKRTAVQDLIPRLEAGIAAARADLPAGVEVVVEAVDGPAEARVEGQAFQDAVEALVKNAHEADGHRIVVRLRRGTRDEDAGATVLEVEDDGSGMDDETRARAFEPFFSTESKKRRGLGLARVWGFACQSGATVRLESRPGAGTTVCVVLPPPHAVSSGWPEVERTDTAPRLDGRGRTVLLVDDEQQVRVVLGDILRGLGFQMLVASNGDDAIRLAREHESDIDLLLTDVIMPGMDGREVAQRFAAIRPDAAVLFISGFPEDELMTRGGGVPSPLLPKPFTARDLETRVGAILEAGR